MRHLEAHMLFDNCKNKSRVLLIDKIHYVRKKAGMVVAELFGEQHTTLDKY